MPKTGSSQIPAKVDLRSFSKKKCKLAGFEWKGAIWELPCWKKKHIPYKKAFFELMIFRLSQDGIC